MNSVIAYIAAAVAIVFFMVAAIVALVIGRGPQADSTPAIATIVGLAGPLLTTLILLIRQEATNKAVQTAQTALDGHIKRVENKEVSSPTT